MGGRKIKIKFSIFKYRIFAEIDFVMFSAYAGVKG
jgi:hypothetical protein